MRRVGTVVRAAGGLAVARRADPGESGAPADPAEDVGLQVVDETLSTVGRVVEAFGPVGSPYLSIRPADGLRPADLLGETLYAR